MCGQIKYEKAFSDGTSNPVRNHTLEFFYYSPNCDVFLHEWKSPRQITAEVDGHKWSLSMSNIIWSTFWNLGRKGFQMIC